MATNLHVNKHIVQTVASSDPLVPLPAGVISVGTDASGIVELAIGGDNSVTVKGLAPGTVTLTYTASGFKPATEVVVVADTPSLVVTDGPEE